MSSQSLTLDSVPSSADPANSGDEVRAERVEPSALTPAERRQLVDELYAVQREVFDGVDREQFRKYVVESSADATWIDVYRVGARVVGYMALHRFEVELPAGGRVVVFRAEAGCLRDYRGKTNVGTLLVTKALPYKLRHPGRRMYFLGALVHPSSYHGMARYATELWPHPRRTTPPAVQALLAQLGDRFELPLVDPANPLIRQVGWITRDSEMERAYWETCEKPAAQFFVQTNPGYSAGHGLLTLVPFTLANLFVGVARFVWGRLSRWLHAARARFQRVPGLGPKVDRAELSAAMGRAPLLAALDADARKHLVSKGRVAWVPRGEYLFRQHEAGDAMYIMIEGSAYVLLEQDGAEMVVSQCGAGEVLGEMALLSGARRTASARSATDAKVLRIPAAAFKTLLRRSPALARTLWREHDRRSFDAYLVADPRYCELSRAQRTSWLDDAEPLHAPSSGGVLVNGPRTVFLAAGCAEVTHAGGRTRAQAPALFEVTDRLRVVPRAGARLLSLPAAR